MQKKGLLFLIPNSISDSHAWIYPELISAIKKTDRFLVETPKIARRFIKAINPSIKLEQLDILVYNKSTPVSEIEELIAPLKQGMDISIITDAGMPGVADPGNQAVLLAQKWKIKVKPFVGPSSIFLALAASGLNGQEFAFHGYLPISEKEAIGKIRNLEIESRKSGATQIFIETPYRNKRIFDLLLRTLNPATLLTIGYNIMGESETIKTKSIGEWKKQQFAFSKLPCLFLILSQ